MTSSSVIKSINIYHQDIQFQPSIKKCKEIYENDLARRFLTIKAKITVIKNISWEIAAIVSPVRNLLS